MKGNKGQGSLEYLIIIAGVLAVAAVVVLFLTSAGSGAAKSQIRSTCVTAAQQCKSLQLTNPGVTCPNACASACSDPRTGIDMNKDIKIYDTSTQSLIKYDSPHYYNGTTDCTHDSDLDSEGTDIAGCGSSDTADYTEVNSPCDLNGTACNICEHGQSFTEL